MRKVVLATVIGLALGAGMALWIASYVRSLPRETIAATPSSTPTPGISMTAKQRIRTLELAINEEREERQVLQVEVRRLTAENERLRLDKISTDSAAEMLWSELDWGGLPTDEADADDRQNSLIEAGFAPLQAEWIVRRESELQMDALQSRYASGSNAGPIDFLDTRIAARKALREEMGDFDYQRYLEATGQATQVAISSVIENSPAHSAGLRIGDEIVTYGGKRIFNMIELADQTVQGAPNEPIVVDIVREGAPMQVVLPRGPLGITAGQPIKR